MCATESGKQFLLVRDAASSGYIALCKVESHERELVCRFVFPLRMRFDCAKIGRCGVSPIHR